MNFQHNKIEAIKKIPVFKTSSWVTSLEKRKHDEIELHNKLRDTSKDKVKTTEPENKKYYCVTNTSSKYIKKLLKDKVKNRVFLDYACGNGLSAIDCALEGALLSVGIDISDVSIINALNSVSMLPPAVSKNLFFFQGDCENTMLPSASIEIVLCSGMLHHLNLEKAYKELARILIPGGLLVGIEALGHNPIFQLYREFTPHLRTQWESGHIMKIKDIEKAEKFGFRISELKFWHFFDLMAVPLRKTKLFKPAQMLGAAADRILFRLSFFQKLAWQVSFVLKKDGA